ncbi:MAG: GNAT family N-acetyltransferase [Theionarchaea archaeon]|nr:GNAT family N-acetyltransferase [Theionarchaea archaeon]MBU7036614.1 GNAT family N-acetyltransferase [Theionarchaea archaeon]
MTRIIQTVEDVNRNTWNALVGTDKVETTYDWFLFCEDVKLSPSLTFCHAVYTEDDEIKGIMPAYSYPIYLYNFVRESGVRPLARLFPRMKTRFNMSKVHIPLSCDFRFFGNMSYFHACLKGIEEHIRINNHFLLVLQDYKESLSLPGYVKTNGWPEVCLDPYPSWERYLESQKGKRAKSIRYEYRKSVDLGTKTFMTDDIDQYTDLLYDMYLNVCDRNEGMITYPGDFFRKMEDHLSPYSRCIFAEDGNDITAYLYLLENENWISCKYAGRTYESEDPYVYFRLMYEMIKYAARKKKPISAEKAAYEAKLRRGFRIVPRFNYHRSYYPVVGDLYLKMYKTIVQFKKIENLELLESLQD